MLYLEDYLESKCDVIFYSQEYTFCPRLPSFSDLSKLSQVFTYFVFFRKRLGYLLSTYRTAKLPFESFNATIFLQHFIFFVSSGLVLVLLI
jgi:hypothetical protein